MQEVQIWPHEQMVYTQPRIRPVKWDAQNSLGFWDTNGSPNLGQITRPRYNHKKKRTRKIVNFAVPVDKRVKLKESEKKDKYQDLGRELKKLWNMKVTVIPFVIGALGKITKGLIKGLEDLEIRKQMKTIQITALSTFVGYLMPKPFS